MSVLKVQMQANLETTMTSQRINEVKHLSFFVASPSCS